ncbi:MAG: aromatic-ring-hydroxylating dioxygenase subunit beta [Acetobacteraceae bacterium]
MISADLATRAEALLLAAAHAIDDDALESWPDFFTPEAQYRIIPRDGYAAGEPIGILSCQGQGMMRDRILALRTANIFEPHRFCHVLSRPVLTPAPGGAVQSRCNFALFRTQQAGSSELFAAGRYLDRIEPHEGALRLAARDVVLESRRVDILIVLPI